MELRSQSWKYRLRKPSEKYKNKRWGDENEEKVVKTRANLRSCVSTKRILKSTSQDRNMKQSTVKSNSSKQEEVSGTGLKSSNKRSRVKQTSTHKKKSRTKTSKVNSVDSVKENVNHSDVEETSGNNGQKLKGLKHKTSTSFKKYGILVPSYEDMLKEREECDKYHKLVNGIVKLVVPLEEIKLDISYDDTPEQLKDCKHMTVDSINSAFQNNLEYLSQIRDGAIYCKRHEMFQKIITRQKLTYNSTMVLFENEHKQILIERLCEQFGDDHHSTEYYFKVLLPELCLKIFMDEYSMNYEEATSYLKYDSF